MMTDSVSTDTGKALAQREQSKDSANSLTIARSNAEARLEPVGEKVGNALLGTCLALTAPTGMSDDERNQWFQSARMTLKGIPRDLLERGCQAAREKCKWPNEVVPTIMATVGPAWRKRQRHLAELYAPDEPDDEQDLVDASEITKLIAAIGRSDD